MKLIIPGQPYAQKRHRTNGNRRYDPSATDKKVIRQHMLQIKPPKPLEGKFEVYITAYFETPKSWSNKKRDEHEQMYRPKKPDADNVEKIIFDAMNDYIIKDDGMIVRSITEKRYSREPRTEIYIFEV